MRLDSLPLFSAPDTSRDAAEAIAQHTPRLRAVVLAALRGAAGGLTAAEIESVTGLSGNTIRPRIIELCEAGQVETNGEQRRTPSGRNARVYVATDTNGGRNG